MRDINVSQDVDKIGGTPPLRGGQNRRAVVSEESSRFLSDCLKFGLDTIVATIALIAVLPMIVMVIVLLLLVQGRPIFIAHRRIGKNGVLFSCYKFRTMVPNADEVLTRYLSANGQERTEWAATRKLKNDPRVTPMGAVLRRSSIDEVPQLLNVILGQMSLVGPRPIAAAEVELYGNHFADYIKVRPGLTGPWQVSGRSDTSYSKRVELDARYVAERSFGGDIVIMAKTIPAVLRARGSY
ncbi:MULTISPECIES: sugar transferase [unclassified Sinorhizobium]|uniref:sugar transferase n=1 Tax=unclassified Sinorhizobium TaxID=2613772 RepID=UPI003525962C